MRIVLISILSSVGATVAGVALLLITYRLLVSEWERAACPDGIRDSN